MQLCSGVYQLDRVVLQLLHIELHFTARYSNQRLKTVHYTNNACRADKERRKNDIKLTRSTWAKPSLRRLDFEALGAGWFSGSPTPTSPKKAGTIQNHPNNHSAFSIGQHQFTQWWTINAVCPVCICGCSWADFLWSTCVEISPRTMLQPCREHRADSLKRWGRVPDGPGTSQVMTVSSGFRLY